MTFQAVIPASGRVGSGGPEGPTTAAQPESPAPLTAQQLAELFPARKAPKGPVLIPILPEAPARHATLEALAADLATRLDGRRAVLSFGMATYLGYDTFPCFSVHAESLPGENAGPCSATYVCAVAVQDTPSAVLARLITEAQARRAGA